MRMRVYTRLNSYSFDPYLIVLDTLFAIAWNENDEGGDEAPAKSSIGATGSSSWKENLRLKKFMLKSDNSWNLFLSKLVKLLKLK